MEHFIEFPSLGWKFHLPTTLVEFDFLGLHLTIKFYGLMIAIGFCLASIYTFKKAKKWKVDLDAFFDVVFVSAILSFVGARLYYVLFSSSLSEYLSNPITILYIWEGGIAIYGAIIFAFVTALIMCKIKKVDTLVAFDLGSLGFLIGQACGRWGNFFNQEAFGGNTTLPWGMTGDIIQSGIHGSGYNAVLPVHPTFLYESLWCILGFVLLHIISNKPNLFKGKIFSLYLIWYGSGRFLIEGLRTDSLHIGTLRTSQLVAIMAIALGIALFVTCKKKYAKVEAIDETSSTLDISPIETDSNNQINE